MLFVIWGHMSPNQEFYIFTSAIKIPLFFAITGYVFNNQEGNWKHFLFGVLRKLVVPWLFLAIFPIFCLSLLKGFSYFVNETVDVLTGEAVWYMPCCIVAEIIWFCILKFSKKQSGILMLVLICFVMGYFFAKHSILDFLMINRALVVQLYISFGYFYKVYEEKLSILSNKTVVICDALYILLCVLSLILFPGQNMDIHKNQYYNVFYCLILIFVGVGCMFMTFSRIKKLPEIIGFIGKNTLVYYMWSSYIIAIFSKVIGTLNLDYMFEKSICLIGGCVGCAIASIVLNKYLPEVLGRKRVVRIDG